MYRKERDKRERPIGDHTTRADVHQGVAKLVDGGLAKGELNGLLHRRIHQRLQFDKRWKWETVFVSGLARI